MMTGTRRKAAISRWGQERDFLEEVRRRGAV
jgi:hypothetical protein